MISFFKVTVGARENKIFKISYSIRKVRNLLILPVASRVLSASAEQRGRCEVEDIRVERRCLPAPIANGVGHLHIQIFLNETEVNAEYRYGKDGICSKFSVEIRNERTQRTAELNAH